MTLPSLFAFTNTSLLISGTSIQQDLYFSPDTGLITPNYTRNRPDIKATKIDLGGEYLVAPGYLELQINGGWRVHFTTLGKEKGDEEERMRLVARELIKRGVTGWWATVPTVEEGRWKEILPFLRPRSFDNASTLLGAHVEGPYLHPTKKGAHDASQFHTPDIKSPSDLYGTDNLKNIIKLITIAPEIPGAIDMIRQLRSQHPQITISLGHSTATYTQGLEALHAGAKGLTHLYNAMQPLHHREPGLAGLPSNNPSTTLPNETPAPPLLQLLSTTTSVTDWLALQMSSLNPTSSLSKPECYYSIIPDLIHLHPSLLTSAFRTSPSHCMLITDAIELAGLPDGVYPPNDQITHSQIKKGNKATIQNTETLIGSCITLDECVRNMVEHAGCSLAEAVRCVTENIAIFMGEDGSGGGRGRGRLDVGFRADFVILDRKGVVRQTWIGGKKVWDIDEDGADGGEK